MAQSCVYQTEKKVVKTMTYFNDTAKMTGGSEHEIANTRGSECQFWCNRDWKREIHAAGFKWAKVVSDGSYNVKAEIVTPVFLLPLDGQAFADLKALFEFIESKGGRIKRGCGLHANIGTRLVTGISSDEFWQRSKDAMELSEQFYNVPSENLTDVMPLFLAKDVIKRYAIHHDVIDSLVSPSRRCENSGIFSYPAPAQRWPQDEKNQSYFCHSIRSIAGNMQQRFDRANDAYDVARILAECQIIYRGSQCGKFAAINMENFGYGRIEFRQHQGTLNATKTAAWFKLIEQMFRHSDATRVFLRPEREITTGTPAMPYRNGSRIGVMWQTMRREGGATTQELMNVTGWDAGTIRARISEMRNAHGQDVILCHTQQRYGNAYGSSRGYHDLNGYEAVIGETRIEPACYALRSENHIGQTSVFAGLDDQTFEYLNARRNANMA